MRGLQSAVPPWYLWRAPGPLQGALMAEKCRHYTWCGLCNNCGCYRAHPWSKCSHCGRTQGCGHFYTQGKDSYKSSPKILHQAFSGSPPHWGLDPLFSPLCGPFQGRHSKNCLEGGGGGRFDLMEDMDEDIPYILGVNWAGGRNCLPPLLGKHLELHTQA